MKVFKMSAEVNDRTRWENRQVMAYEAEKEEAAAIWLARHTQARPRR